MLIPKLLPLQESRTSPRKFKQCIKAHCNYLLLLPPHLYLVNFHSSVIHLIQQLLLEEIEYLIPIVRRATKADKKLEIEVEEADALTLLAQTLAKSMAKNVRPASHADK